MGGLGRGRGSRLSAQRGLAGSQAARQLVGPRDLPGSGGDAGLPPRRAALAGGAEPALSRAWLGLPGSGGRLLPAVAVGVGEQSRVPGALGRPLLGLPPATPGGSGFLAAPLPLGTGPDSGAFLGSPATLRGRPPPLAAQTRVPLLGFVGALGAPLPPVSCHQVSGCVQGREEGRVGGRSHVR